MKSIWYYSIGTDAVYTCNYMQCNETTTDTTMIYYNSNNKLCIEQYGIEPQSTYTSLSDMEIGVFMTVVSSVLFIVLGVLIYVMILDVQTFINETTNNQLEPTINNGC